MEKQNNSARYIFYLYFLIITAITLAQTQQSFKTLQRQQQYVELTFCEDALCTDEISMMRNCYFQWDVCTFLPEMESYFWFEKNTYGSFYRVCSDWTCFNCSICGTFQTTYETCMELPFFNLYGKLQAVEWYSDPPTTTSSPDPSVGPTASKDPPTVTPIPSSSNSSSTTIPKSKNDGGSDKIGSKNATSSSTISATPSVTHTPSSTTSPHKGTPDSTKIHNSSGGLDAGSIAGIVIGSLAGALMVIGATTFLIRRRSSYLNLNQRRAMQ